VPDVVTTWTVVHQRPLMEGEDPFSPGNVDPEHLLWALDEGTISVAVDLVETREHGS
jgi:hypothetical protein